MAIPSGVHVRPKFNHGLTKKTIAAVRASKPESGIFSRYKYTNDPVKKIGTRVR